MLSGRELKIKRIILNIKAKEIADKLGLSKGYVSLMESDTRNIPKNIYDKWIKFLGIK